MINHHQSSMANMSTVLDLQTLTYWISF